MKRRTNPLLVFLCFFFSDAVAGESTDEPYELEPIIVTPKQDENDKFENTRAITVIETDEIKNQLPQVMTDILRGKTGVFVQQTTPGQGIPIIRGLKGSEVLHLVDGMRLNNGFFRNAPNQYFTLVDPQNVERIEVIRGPASVLYGSDAMGGVVKVITPEPRFKTDTWKSEHKIFGQFASADLSTLTRIATQAGKRGIGISGGVTYQDVNDRRVGGGDMQRPSDFTSLAANGTLLFELTQSQEFRLDVQYLRQPKTPRFDELVAGFGQTNPSSKVFFFEPNDRLFIHGRYRIKKPLTFIDQLEINLSNQQINDDRRIRDFGSVDENRERNRSSLTSLTLKANSAWGDRISSIYGIELNSDNISSQRVSTDIETGLSEHVPSRFPNDSSIESYAFYLQNRFNVFPDLALTFGGRYSLFDIKLPEVDRGVGTNLKIDDLTGSLGMEYRITPTLLLRSNLGRGFRPPNIFDLGALGPRPGNRFNIPNPSLKPENIVTVDTGVDFTMGRFYGELFGYYSDFNDKITSVATGEVTNDGRIVVQNQNSNEVRLWGAELYARYSWDGLELYANLTHTWGEEKLLDGTKQPADRIPPLNGRFGFRYYPTARLWIEPFILFATRQDRLNNRDANDPRINPNGTPGWATANLHLGWDLNPKWTLRFALRNLADSNYREHGSGIDAPGINAILSLTGRI